MIDPRTEIDQHELAMPETNIEALIHWHRRETSLDPGPKVVEKVKILSGFEGVSALFCCNTHLRLVQE